MNKLLKICLGTVLFFLFVLVVKADSDGITTVKVAFPIAELGNCNSKQECKTYCDKTENISACAAFAQSHGLISQQQKEKADKLSTALKSGPGPGGCTDATSCKNYCDDFSHGDDCATFAQVHNLAPKEKIETAKKISDALKNGAGPGGCKTAEECKTFCSQRTNQSVCLDFAKSNGLISQDESAKAGKFIESVKFGQTPGGCTTKEACQKYCQDQSHKDDCLKFLVKIGGINQEAAEKIKQSGNKGPGDCESKEACDAYCSVEENRQTCIDFARERGINIPKPTQPNSDFTNCVKTSLGQQANGTLSTSNLTEEQKAAIAKCRSQFPPGQSENGNRPIQQLPQSNLKDCLIKILGEDAVKNINTASLTDEQKAALLKCKQQAPTAGGKPAGVNASGTPPHLGSSGSDKIKQCLLEKLGQDGMQKLVSGTADFRQQNADILKQCGYPVKPMPTGQPGSMTVPSPSPSGVPNQQPKPPLPSPSGSPGGQQPPPPTNGMPPPGGVPPKFPPK